MSTRLEIESFFKGEDFSETLTRAKFEELNMDLFKRTLKPVEQVLKPLIEYGRELIKLHEYCGRDEASIIT